MHNASTNKVNLNPTVLLSKAVTNKKATGV